jgi:hypothetical protein
MVNGSLSKIRRQRPSVLKKSNRIRLGILQKLGTAELALRCPPLDQNAKYSERADVFRSTLKNGHHPGVRSFPRAADRASAPLCNSAPILQAILFGKNEFSSSSGAAPAAVTGLFLTIDYGTIYRSCGWSPYQGDLDRRDHRWNAAAHSVE